MYPSAIAQTLSPMVVRFTFPPEHLNLYGVTRAGPLPAHQPLPALMQLRRCGAIVAAHAVANRQPEIPVFLLPVRCHALPSKGFLRCAVRACRSIVLPARDN